MSNIRAIRIGEWTIRKYDGEGREVDVFMNGDWVCSVKLNHPEHWFDIPAKAILALDWLAKDGGFA